MKGLGEPQITLTFKTFGAGKHYGEPTHEEAGPMCPPDIRIEISGSAKIKQVALDFPAERCRHVITALCPNGDRDKRKADGMGQCPERPQIAGRLAFEARQRFLGHAGSMGPPCRVRKLRLRGGRHLLEQARGGQAH